MFVYGFRAAGFYHRKFHYFGKVHPVDNSWSGFFIVFFIIIFIALGASRKYQAKSKSNNCPNNYTLFFHNLFLSCIFIRTNTAEIRIGSNVQIFSEAL